MTFETGVIFFISLVLLWLKPGPGQALRVTYALQYGFLSAFLIALGVLTVCLGYFMFVVLGYSALSSSTLPFVVLLKLLGATYMLYLGYIGLIEGKDIATAQTKAHEKKGGVLKHYSLGLLMALSNPIGIFYFVGILPTLVPVDELTKADILMGLGLIAFAGILVDGLLLALTVLAKKSFSDSGIFKHMGIITSLSFIVIGLFLMYSAIFLPDGLYYTLLD